MFRGVDWDGFYCLLYQLQHVELWVRFIAFDSVRDYRLDKEEFSGIIQQLAGCGILKPEVANSIKKNPQDIFSVVDADDSGYVRFKEFCSFCVANAQDDP